MIKPSVNKAYNIERTLDYKDKILEAVKETQSIVIHANKKLNIIDKGFTVKEALNETD
jgi:hypothetical protein